jgi:hypothetical protein
MTGGGPGVAGIANSGGGGGGGGGGSNPSGAGGSGVVVFKYPTAWSITIGAGLTGSTVNLGLHKVSTITAGTGNISWTI